MKSEEEKYPIGLKVGDFIQESSHFGDVYFEVASCWPPADDSSYWSVTYVDYDKYGSHPFKNSINSASSIRKVIPAEMAIPVMLHQGFRFKSVDGQYDPMYGYSPKGTPLRVKDWAPSMSQRGG